jgi:hypothetical protein
MDAAQKIIFTTDAEHFKQNQTVDFDMLNNWSTHYRDIENSMTVCYWMKSSN